MKLAAKVALTMLGTACLAVALGRRLPSTQPVVVAQSAARDEEAQLMHQAQAALAVGDTDTTFSLLYEQATKFPQGKLVQQRTLTHSQALCRAGKADEARAEAASLLAQHPGPALAEQLKSVCPGAP